MIRFLKDVLRRIIGEVPTRTLRKRGMLIGENFNRQQGCFLDPTHAWLIEIGNDVTMSIRVTVLAHDASTKIACGYTKIAKTKISDNTFFGANSTIMPGVNIGENSIIGANSVVTKDVPANVVAAGNPAKIICTIDEYSLKIKERFDATQNKYDESFRFSKNLDSLKKEKMIKDISQDIGFIK